MKRSLLILFIFISLETGAQDFYTVYYNANWEMTSMSYGKYYRNSGFDTAALSFNGTVTDYYIDGSIEMKGNYTRGIRDGEFIYYYPDRSIRLRSSYTNNCRSGKWTSYYENGQVCKVVDYGDGTERLTEYYDSNGQSLLKKLKKYEYVFYYDPDTEALLPEKLRDNSAKYLIEGEMDNGLKTGAWTVNRFQEGSRKVEGGDWTTYFARYLMYEMKFRNGSFISGWKYLSDDEKQKMERDTLTFLIAEPAKLKITEALKSEPGQMIMQNYIIKAIQDHNRKFARRVELENEDELVDFFNTNYSRFIKNCTDTLRMNIGLKYDDQDKVLVDTVYPRIGTGFTREAYRIIDMISRVKNHSPSRFLFQYRIQCVDELDFKK